MGEVSKKWPGPSEGLAFRLARGFYQKGLKGHRAEKDIAGVGGHRSDKGRWLV